MSVYVMSMTTDQSTPCSQETMGAEDSNTSGLDGLKSKITFMPHLIEVINRCSESTRKEIKHELIDYLDEMEDKSNDSNK